MTLEASVIVRAGPRAGKRLSISSELILGRESADLPIDDDQVSRRHACVRAVGGHLEIEDLNSLNGTYVNGERIHAPARLAAGDRIRLGRTELEVERVPGKTAVAVAQGPEAQARKRPVAAGARDREQSPKVKATPPPVSGFVEHDELRPVTALFADIVGSTTLGEELAADEVKSVIGGCVSLMSSAVEEFDGWIQSYMGDGICALFGVPNVREDDASRAASAALRILEVVHSYAIDVEKTWGITGLAVRVGLNSGRAGVGLIGSADPQPVALGDVTNVAARLQSAAEPTSVLVGEITAQLIATRFSLEPIGELTVKGRVTPVRAWRLTGRVRVEPATPTPLIGRDHEVAVLESAIESLVAGRGQIMLVTGPLGIGKTRLLGELEARARGKAGWLFGQARPYGHDVAYGPFIEILRAWLGAPLAESTPALGIRLRRRALELLAGREQLLDPLGRLLGIKPSDDDAQMTGADVAASIRSAYCEWIESLATKQPLILAIDDLHAADDATATLFQDLLQVTDRAGVLVVGTLRRGQGSHGQALWLRVFSEYSYRSTELSLAPLTGAASEDLLAARAPAELAPDVRRQINERAEGIPLYLEELLRAMIDSGAMRRSHGTLTFAGTPNVPPALEGLLVARIDALPSSARQLAHCAAVIGRVFPLSVLMPVASSEDIERDLGVLVRSEVIRETRRFPEREYAFKHGLLHDAALTTLTPRRRATLAARVAEVFESLDPDTSEAMVQLARYYSQSGSTDKALAYLDRAAEMATTAGATGEARELWRRAVALAGREGNTAAKRRFQARIGALEKQ